MPRLRWLLLLPVLLRGLLAACGSAPVGAEVAPDVAPVAQTTGSRGDAPSPAT